MDITITPQSGDSYTHMWDVASMKQLDGGYLLDTATLPTTATTLAKGTMLKIDESTRKASVVKTAKLYEAITAEATTVKIHKNSLLLSTDYIGYGGTSCQVGTITEGEDYDSFVIVADTFGVVANNSIFQQTSSLGVVINPDGLNPFDVTIDTQPSCSVMFKADGVITSVLPQFITDAIKTALKFIQFLNL